ncbi:hypothetical protein PROFUN_06794 [Planoprotostelium fungivorum]|uniref:Homeobox domain-containing protein n=1 Tax=Planoprotostelium fungivorum TaxID=1890364 RepID=A0A2P6NNP7_9EUKA|nr:hypothetical protein PROFUN_06794 [Planoprotostelium fungivorum]
MPPSCKSWRTAEHSNWIEEKRCSISSSSGFIEYLVMQLGPDPTGPNRETQYYPKNKRPRLELESTVKHIVQYEEEVPLVLSSSEWMSRSHRKEEIGGSLKYLADFSKKYQHDGLTAMWKNIRDLNDKDIKDILQFLPIYVSSITSAKLEIEEAETQERDIDENGTIMLRWIIHLLPANFSILESLRTLIFYNFVESAEALFYELWSCSQLRFMHTLETQPSWGGWIDSLPADPFDMLLYNPSTQITCIEPYDPLFENLKELCKDVEFSSEKDIFRQFKMEPIACHMLNEFKLDKVLSQHEEKPPINILPPASSEDDIWDDLISTVDEYRKEVPTLHVLNHDSSKEEEEEEITDSPSTPPHQPPSSPSVVSVECEETDDFIFTCGSTDFISEVEVVSDVIEDEPDEIIETLETYEPSVDHSSNKRETKQEGREATDKTQVEKVAERKFQEFCFCEWGDAETGFMIFCEGCKRWFHGQCVQIDQRMADDIERYHCADCEPLRGPSVHKGEEEPSDEEDDDDEMDYRYHKESKPTKRGQVHPGRVFTTQQRDEMIRIFKTETQTPTTQHQQELADKFGVQKRSVMIWFANRRAATRRKNKR